MTAPADEIRTRDEVVPAVPVADVPEPPADQPDAAGTDAAGEGAAGSAEAEAEPLAAITARLAELTAVLERHHDRAAARERVIDQLNAELDRLRAGDRRGLVRPVLVELCRLRDDLLKQAASLPGQFTAEQARELLLSYADTVELNLESHGVAPFAPAPGDAFNPRRHRRTATVPTPVPQQHGTVAATDRSGYADLQADQVLQPAGVTVYTHRPAPDPVPEPGPAVQPAGPHPSRYTERPTDDMEEQQP